MNRAEILKKLVKERSGGSVAEFSRIAKKSPSQIHQWLKGYRQLGDGGARQIEMAFDLPQGYFDNPLISSRKETADKEMDNNVVAIPKAKNGGIVPIISWVQAGAMEEVVDQYQPGYAEDWLPCPANHGRNTFALKVEGDSMESRHGRSYPPGIFIFVDPDRPVTNGCRVIAKDSEGRATFKSYQEDGSRRYLVPLNDRYEHIEMDAGLQIVGVVIGAYMPE